jgi:hypothetical protein
MLGMSCVPGTPRLMPLGDESGAEGARGRTDAAIASAKAPRPESTLLIASGETCGPLIGSPTPGVVDASSIGTEGGGP